MTTTDPVAPLPFDMTNLADSDKKIGIECLTDHYLRSHVETAGSRGSCSYCHAEGTVIRFEELMRILAAGFAHEYQPVEDEWNRVITLPSGQKFLHRKDPGTPIEEALTQECVTSHPGLISDIVTAFGGEGQWHNLDDLFPADYYDWKSIVHSVIGRRRYTLLLSESHDEPGTLNDFVHELSWVVEQLDLTRTLEVGTPWWRVRPHNVDECCCPARKIGPAPTGLSGVGRMNAPGIPMFYGADSGLAALREVDAYERPTPSDKRQPGRAVTIGKFVQLKELKVFDLTKIPEGPISLFHPLLGGKRVIVANTRIFREIIASVADPKDEAKLGYVAPQLVAEYLHFVEKFDGILWQSTQSDDAICCAFFLSPGDVTDDYPVNPVVSELERDIRYAECVLAHENPEWLPEPPVLGLESHRRYFSLQEALHGERPVGQPARNEPQTVQIGKIENKVFIKTWPLKKAE